MNSVLFTCMAVLIGNAIAPVPAFSAGSISITGYIEQGTAQVLIDRSSKALSTVGVDGINLNATGSAVTQVDPSARLLLRRAHADGLRAELLVGNFDNAIGDFSSKIAQALLLSPNHIRGVAAQLSAIVQTEGWDGVTIDLESLNERDASGLVSFVTALRADLAGRATLSIDVSASTSLGAYAAGGYDLTALGRVVNRVVLMAYDQHGPWSQPGPIGSLNWQRQSLRVLLTRVRASSVDLGVAGYGYTWPKGSKVHSGTSLSDAQARFLVRRAHARAHWVTGDGEWTATLSDGTVIWWSDLRSIRLREAMAQQFSLHGVALWQLASSDPL